MTKLWLRHAPQGAISIGINVVMTVLRLVLVTFAGVFLGAMVSVGSQSDGPVGALWFFAAGIAAFVLWNLWDVAKSWGWIPAARVLIAESHIAFETPFWRRSFMAGTFNIGEPIDLVVSEIPIFRAAKSMHIYAFRQGETKVRYLAPMSMTEESAQALTRALDKVGTRLSVPFIPR